jgi:hypothetical protein
VPEIYFSMTYACKYNNKLLTRSYFGEELILPKRSCPEYSRYYTGDAPTENDDQHIIEVTLTNFTFYIPQFKYYTHTYTFKWYAIGYVETDGY